MNCCNAYESDSMREALGETLRPGGFSLTEKGVQFCKLSASDRVLDLGCGRGATVRYLYEQHKIRAIGVDPSQKLIEEANKQCPYADFIFGQGENLPFAESSFNCVFAECTLSLMEDDSALKQVSRVLKENGWFVISDVYAKNPDAVRELQEFSINSCMRGLHNLPLLEEKLKQADLEIVYSEDCSFLLKELLVKIAFSYGSMSAFWNVTGQNCMDGCNFHEALKKCKPGYFLLICRKAGATHG